MIQQFILGGYTKRSNLGLSLLRFDDEEGTFIDVIPVASLSQPTYVGLSVDHQQLFAINKGEHTSGLVSFVRDENGQWQQANEVLNSHIPGCHVFYRDNGDVYVANYHEGKVYPYHSRPTLEAFQSPYSFSTSGSNVHPNQDTSRIHFVGSNREQTLFFVCDLGADEIHSIPLDSDGNWDMEHKQTFQAPAGSGPRHLVIHPTLNIAYIMCELNSTTLIVSIDNHGTLTLLQVVDNIPREYVATSSGAAIHCSSDGNFIYTSTRGYNVLTSFSIHSNGTLTHLQTIDSNGLTPRDFALDQTERFVIVPHQDSDNVSLFLRNALTGMLTATKQSIIAPECTCITRY